MRIAVFGSSLLSTYWSGSATYFRGLLGELARRGHRVTFYEPEAQDRQERRDGDGFAWAESIVYRASEEEVMRCLREARRADVVVKVSGIGVFDELLEEAVLDLLGHGRLVIYWDIEAPATLARIEANGRDPQRTLIPAYDLVLASGGGDGLARRYRELGARRCSVIYPALDPRTHHAVTPERRFAGAIGFMGNRLPDREARFDELLLSVAARSPARRFLLAGAGWDGKLVPENVRLLGHVGSAEHNAFNSSVDLVLNVTRAELAARGWSPPPRLFEAAGAGACIVSDAWQGLDRFLEPGREVMVARGADELAELLASLDASRRQSIGAAARRRVASQHTYAQRVRDLERAIDGAESSDLPHGSRHSA